jgi:hypothetical protein
MTALLYAKGLIVLIVAAAIIFTMIESRMPAMRTARIGRR